MDIENFENLLKRNESDTLDFKATMYDFQKPEKEEKERERAKFVKDILCMANTPREVPAYIVLGVKKQTDNTFELCGIAEQIDGNDLQQQLEGWIYPHPPMHYEPIRYQEKNFGVIIIPADRTIGPFYSREDVGNILHANQLYHRRDSTNSEADSAWQGKIWNWFRNSEKTITLEENDSLPWNEFVRAVDGFDSERRYILITSRPPSDKAIPIENLGFVKWSFVMDFDPESGETGTLAKCRSTIEQHRTLHPIVISDKPVLNTATGTYWYFARGMKGREASIEVGKFKDWQRHYDKDVNTQLESLAKEIAFQPTTVVLISNDVDLIEHFYTVTAAINAKFDATASVVIVTNQKDAFRRLVDVFDARILSIPFHQLCHGLEVLNKSIGNAQSTAMTLPSSSNAPISLGEKDALWLSEELEIIHQNVGLQLNKSIIPGRDFLRGHESEISWYELGLDCDVRRDVSVNLAKEIRAALERRRNRRINLYHTPGAGGTTVARRIIWDFRTDFPCAILKRTEPKETAERLAYIYALTGMPVLLTLDGSEISERQSDELYEVITSRQTPVVMFQVLRRSKFQKEDNLTLALLDTKLSDIEFGRFVHKLSTYMPAKRQELESLGNSTNLNFRSPFHMGLVTFEREFESIEKYVKARLDNLDNAQIKIMQYLALAQYYGQQAMPAQAFIELLGVPVSRLIKLAKLLPQSTTELIVEVEPGKWRVTHQLIAEEILIQTLANKIDRRLWKQGLSDLAIEFVNVCRGPLAEPNEAGLEIARRVFVYRDNSELLGTEQSGERGGNPLFAQLISDIKLPEAKLRVLEYLTNIFSEEAHFWAHLGRLYSLEFKQFDKALEAIDKGINLLPEDHVLHHMRGMALRSAVYFLIEQKNALDSILEKAKFASESFQKARMLDPVDEHAYISEAQMIVRVLEYASKSNNQQAAIVVANSDDLWLREAFSAVEDLLDHVRGNRLGEDPSDFEARCRADLDALYGNHEKALQAWDNLLHKNNIQSRRSIFAPPIRRQIVWTLLYSKNRSWGKLSPKQIDRCVTLLEDNLRDEPNDERNIRLWIQAARFQPDPPSLENVIEKVAYWKSNSNVLDAVYYLFVLHSIRAINGYPLSRDQAERVLEECRKMARYRRDRTRSFEWVGNEEGLRQLVHQSSLGEWDVAQAFWRSTSALKRIKGVIASIQGPESGWIEIPGGLTAFFVPGAGSQKRAQQGSKVSAFAKGRSEGQTVTLYLGFSYDGLRAWSVDEMT